ncbi:MAG: hypothetical protein IJ985_00420, partial [Akkermansia sp.]|nr:hypothetical protein [Akkermansia sp.]
NRLTDTLLSGLGVSHSKIENWFFVLVAEVYFIFTKCQANWDEKTFFLKMVTANAMLTRGKLEGKKVVM